MYNPLDAILTPGGKKKINEAKEGIMNPDSPTEVATDIYNSVSGGIDRRLAEQELQKGITGARNVGLPLYQQANTMYGQYAGMAGMYPQIQQGLSRGQYSLTGAGQPVGNMGFDYNGAKNTLRQQLDSGMISKEQYKQANQSLMQQQLQSAQNPQGQQGMGMMQPGKMGMYRQPELERFDFNFEEDPGYQFARDQGLDAINRQMRAKGLTGSTSHDQEAMKFATGLASQQYGDAYNRNLNRYGMEQGQRMGLAGMGQQAHEFYGGQMERDINRGLGAQMGLAGIGLGQFNRQAGSYEDQADWLSNLATGSAQAKANRYMGDAAAGQNMLGQLFGAAGTIGGAYVGRPQGGK